MTENIIKLVLCFLSYINGGFFFVNISFYHVHMPYITAMVNVVFVKYKIFKNIKKNLKTCTVTVDVLFNTMYIFTPQNPQNFVLVD